MKVEKDCKITGISEAYKWQMEQEKKLRRSKKRTQKNSTK